MKILFVSQVVSSSTLNHLFEDSGKDPGFAIQKYNNLIISGFKKNGVEVEVLAKIPQNPKTCKFGYKAFKTEIDNGVRYNIVPYFTNSALYRIVQTIYTFFYVLNWSLRNRGKGYIFIDVLCKSLAIGSIYAGKIARVTTTSLVTDMPGMSHSGCLHYDQFSLFDKFHFRTIARSSSFVLVSKYSNEVINTNNKPYIIMEGLVDPMIELPQVKKRVTKDFFYAGGINKAYGIEMLVDAFMKLNSPDVRLVLYGNGPYVSELEEKAKLDRRIEYRGVAVNSKIVEAEIESSFLVNPRPSKQEFALYSFPSKNLEYMFSGTPIITTLLPATPEEYLPHIIVLKDETVEGYFQVLSDAMQMSEEEIVDKGNKARSFIVNTRSNEVQVGRIIKMMKSL